MSILSQPLPTQPGRPCKGGCGREVNPGTGRYRYATRDEKGKRGVEVPGGTCIYCLVGSRLIAVPRARRLIRGGSVRINESKPVPAVGRGPNRRALRKARAYARRDRLGQEPARRLVSAVRRREADRARSTAVEAGRREKAA